MSSGRVSAPRSSTWAVTSSLTAPTAARKVWAADRGDLGDVGAGATVDRRELGREALLHHVAPGECLRAGAEGLDQKGPGERRAGRHRGRDTSTARREPAIQSGARASSAPSIAASRPSTPAS